MRDGDLHALRKKKMTTSGIFLLRYRKRRNRRHAGAGVETVPDFLHLWDGRGQSDQREMESPFFPLPARGFLL